MRRKVKLSRILILILIPILIVSGSVYVIYMVVYTRRIGNRRKELL